MKRILHITCLITGLSFALVSQYPTYVIAQDMLGNWVFIKGTAGNFGIEDRSVYSSGVSDSVDNATILENTTAAPKSLSSDFATEPGSNDPCRDPALADLCSSDFATEPGSNDPCREPALSDLCGGAATDFGTSDFGDDENRFELNTRKIADELIGLTPMEISQFPITALSVTDIKAVLNFLNSFHLAKVLLNIPGEDLLEVKKMFSPLTFNQTINRLSVENRTQVEDRLSTIPAIP